MRSVLRPSRRRNGAGMEILAAIVLFAFTVNLGAQSSGTHTARLQTASAKAMIKPAAMSMPAEPSRPDLNASLADLERVTAATDADIAGLEIDKWRAGWRTAWLRNRSHKQQAEQVAAALRRNLAQAMPGLIREAQISRGSISSTFKLYNNLSVVYEALDSLVEVTRAYGKKGESGPLTNDRAAMASLRQELSAYIQQAASSIEPRTGPPPRRIVVDDNLPIKHARKKKTGSPQP